VSAILDQVRLLVTEHLHAHAHRLAEPVGARFLPARNGTTGVAVRVRLTNAEHAPAARAALAARFGVGIDVFDVR
jgi:hypothetical protein